MNQAFSSRDLAKTDPAVAETLKSPLSRQQNQIELIASENKATAALVVGRSAARQRLVRERRVDRKHGAACLMFQSGDRTGLRWCVAGLVSGVKL